MALIIKNFEWQEDIDNFNFTEWCVSNKGISTVFRVYYKLTWKGKFRKFFRIRKHGL